MKSSGLDYKFSFLSVLNYWSFHLKSDESSQIDEELLKTSRDIRHWDWLKRDLAKIIDKNGHAIDSYYWESLREELIRLADYQQSRENGHVDINDSFADYAELYDEVIGKPCLNHFMKNYIRRAFEDSGKDLSRSTLLSIGCGTGLAEEHIISSYPIPRESVLGLDNSASMVEVAKKRVRAELADFLETKPVQKWDFTYTGLNVFQYFPAEQFEKAVEKASQMTKPNGWFLGDFIAPDHIRWYPNVIGSENVISLRQPRLIEKDFQVFQQSEIINVNKLRGEFRVTFEGKHSRYLPSVQRVKRLFEKNFRHVRLLDAVSLEPLPENAETTPSTRYVVLAKPE